MLYTPQKLENKSFRTSNVVCVLRVSLYLDSLSICTESVIYIWNLRITRIAFLRSLVSSCCSVTRCHINILSYFSYHSVSVSETIVITPSHFQAFQEPHHYAYTHSAMDVTPTNQAINNSVCSYIYGS